MNYSTNYVVVRCTRLIDPVFCFACLSFNLEMFQKYFLCVKDRRKGKSVKIK